MRTATPRESVHARVAPELRAWLDHEADVRFVSTSFLVTRALELLRDHLDTKPVAA